MKSISKWLVPGFLRRLDQYLREHYPVLWYTGAHGVLFYGLLGGVVLFGAGLLYPVHWVKRELVGEKYMNLDQWVVDPIKPIVFAYDELYIYPLMLVIAVAGIWLYRQYQIRPFFYRMRHSLLCLLIYIGCWWVLGGFSAAAFRMGTIVKTACLWMPERDLQDFKQSGVYPYGFVTIKDDSPLMIPKNTLSFFKKREKIFQHIWKKEETLLNSRYRVGKLYWEENMAEFGFLDHSRLYLASRSDRPDLSDRSDRFDYSHRLYRLYRSDRSQWRDMAGLPDLPDVHGGIPNHWLVMPFKYGELTKNRVAHPKASVYNLINYNDTLNADPLVIIPSLPNQIEDAVRSVEHARQFLQEGIFWRYFLHLLHYLLLLSVLLFLLPWISPRSLLQLGVMALVGWFGLQFFEIKDWEWYNSIWKWVHIAIYLAIPMLGLVLLLYMFWQQKQGLLLVLAINMVFLGVFVTLLGALNYGESSILKQFGSPIDAAFYGAQLIGLLAACIVPYVQAMPKAR